MLKKTVISLLLSIFSLSARAVQSNNNNRPAIPDTWQKITMVYYHDFPCKERCQHEGVAGCIRIHNRTDKWTIRCQEQVNLLRPKKVVSIWQQIEKKKGYVTLNIPEFSIKGVHAWIIAMDQIHENHFPDSGDTGYITGIFKRHIMNVNKYVFKNLKTGAVSLINVTPDHRFYVKNKESFIPVSQVTPSDTLINSRGEKIKLACLNQNERHCHLSGKSVNTGTLPVRVYNLEVHGKSCYFSGKEKILVHNICMLARELQYKLPHLVITKGSFRWKRSYLELNGLEDMNRVWDVLKQIYPENMQCEVCSALAASEYTGKKLRIDLLQKFLLSRQNFTSGKGSFTTYLSSLKDLLKPFGKRAQIAKDSIPEFQQTLGEDYRGAAIIAGGRHVGFVRGGELRDCYYTAIIKTEGTDCLQEKVFGYSAFKWERWGVDSRGKWHIKFFIPLKRRSWSSYLR